MRTLLTAILLLLHATLWAQKPAPTLASVDTAVAALCTEIDAHRYSYDVALWTEAARNAFAQATDSALQAFCPTHLSRLNVDDRQIFYFIKKAPHGIVLNWITRHGNEATVFTDNIPSSTSGAIVVNATVTSNLHGFEIVDTLSGKQIFLMPDIDTRLNFEILADMDRTDEEKDAAQELISKALHKLWLSADANTLNLSGLPRLYVVDNDKHTLRIATYMTAYSNFESRCYGTVIYTDENGAHRYDLTDQTEKIKSPERVKLNAAKWYGAVYYEMLETRIGKKTYYTLLGFKSNDGLVKTRVIEIVEVDDKRCAFGAPVFLHPKATYNRRVFRYSAGVNMLLRYDVRKRLLVFDHLSPSESLFKGEYQFYGPDFSYDGYKLTRKGWEFADDVEMRNE